MLTLRHERAVDRAPFGDLEQPLSLLRTERTVERDLPLDAIEHALLRLALGAVRRVNLRMREPHRHALEGPLLPSRVQRDRHRRSGAERDQQEVIGRGPGVGAAVRDRLVRGQMMPTDEHLLRKP